MSDSVRPHRRQPTGLPRPWDSPGKNTGVGCHFLLQCMKVKSQSEVTQSYPTLSDPMDYSLPGSSVHGIFQAGVLEWGAITFSCNPMDGSLSGSSIHGISQAGILEWVAIFFPRGIFLTQGLNPGLPHYRQTLYHLSHQGSPRSKYRYFKRSLSDSKS